MNVAVLNFASFSHLPSLNFSGKFPRNVIPFGFPYPFPTNLGCSGFSNSNNRVKEFLTIGAQSFSHKRIALELVPGL